MNETIDTQNQCIAVYLRRTFRKKTGFEFFQNILGYPKEKSILSIGHICDAVRKYLELFLGKFFLVTLIWEETFSGYDLANKIPVVAAPFAAGEFYSAVFVNSIYTAIIAYPGAFTGPKPGYFLWQG